MKRWGVAAAGLGLAAVAAALGARDEAPSPSPPAPSPRPLAPPVASSAVPLDQEAAQALQRGELVFAPLVALELGPYELLVATDAPSRAGLRLSVSHLFAQQLADLAGCLLPTPAIVDALELAAEVRPAPHPQMDLARMMSSSSWEKHAAELNHDAGPPPSPVLVAPVGKDYVQVPRLRAQPDRCAIYGWAKIQPVSLVHESTYRDYSHIGPRLVARRVVRLADGAELDLADLYEAGDPVLAPLGSTPARHPAAPLSSLEV